MNLYKHPPRHSREQDSELNIESIISAVLVSLSKANTLMLNGQTSAILNLYFTKNNKTASKKEGDTYWIYQPKLIHMLLTKYQQVEQEQVKQELVFEVPLLALAPLNSIAIQKMHLAFNLDITSITSYINNSNSIIERKAQLNGKISRTRPPFLSRKKRKKFTQQSLHIDIQVGSLPLPLGILTLVELYNKNIQPVNI